MSPLQGLRQRKLALAALYVAAGDLEAAFRALARAVEEGAHLVFVGAEPGLDPIRADPRFAAVLGDRLR